MSKNSFVIEQDSSCTKLVPRRRICDSFFFNNTSLVTCRVKLRRDSIVKFFKLEKILFSCCFASLTTIINDHYGSSEWPIWIQEVPKDTLLKDSYSNKATWIYNKSLMKLFSVNQYFMNIVVLFNKLLLTCM